MNRDLPDLFRDGITGSMLRWLVERGQCTASEFRTERIERGGTVNGTHSFDRYIADKKPGRFNTYIPSQGTHGVIVRTDNKHTLTWVGSQGNTGFERAVSWLRQLSQKQVDKAITKANMRLLHALGSIDAHSVGHKFVVSKQGAVAVCGYATVDEAIFWFMAMYALPHGTLNPLDILTDEKLSTLINVLERMMLEATTDETVPRISAWFKTAQAEDAARGARRDISPEAHAKREHDEMVRDYLDQRPVIEY